MMEEVMSVDAFDVLAVDHFVNLDDQTGFDCGKFIDGEIVQFYPLAPTKVVSIRDHDYDCIGCSFDNIVGTCSLFAADKSNKLMRVCVGSRKYVYV